MKEKLTRPSEDVLFFRKEKIDALKRSDEKRRKDGQVSADSVGTQLHGINSTIVKMKEEDDRCKQIIERITNMEKKILDMDEKSEMTNPGEHM